MSLASTRLKPRKTPVQARSTSTVESIFEATLQVLINDGVERLTTTRVAQRAGVSVGTLYQYFPNKQSLLAAVLERYLGLVVEAVEAACAKSKGQSIKSMASAVVAAFMLAKLQRPEASKALYGVATELGGAQVVARMTHRSQLALCDMLATATDARFSDLAMVSFVLSTALIGPVQGLLESEMTPSVVNAMRTHLTMLSHAYLRGVAVAR